MEKVSYNEEMEAIESKIIENPLFQKLKNVVENNPWHDNETVYNHLLKTHKIAQEKINADFISNPEAKKSFLEFVNSEYEGVKIANIMLITALVHDIGKVLYYKDGETEQPLRHEDPKGQTKMPAHEYWGSTIIPELLKDTGLNEKVIEKIAKSVRLHDTFNDGYMSGLNIENMEEVLDEVKARGEGSYKEVMFNIYCDVHTAPPSKESITKIEHIFNQPSFYSSRTYFVK